MIDRNKVIVIDRQGNQITLDQWQKIYGLPYNSTKIGKYFDLNEPRFQEDIRLYGEIVVNELLIRVLDQFREDVKRPININAFNRNQAKQNQLQKDGFRAASVSPHVVLKDRSGYRNGFAADVDTTSKEQTNKEVIILGKAAAKLRIKVRIGWKEYQELNQTFIHVDVACEYYAFGKPWHNKQHPLAWERESRW